MINDKTGMTKVKICGLTNLEDAKKAEELGADFLGFVFFENSPRAVDAEKAKEIISNLHGSSEKAGLFLNQDINFVKTLAGDIGLDLIQLHGDEGPEYVAELSAKGGKDFKVIKSFKIKKDFDFSVLSMYETADFYLFDTYVKGIPGGSGLSFDWNLLEGKSFSKPIFLAGGLTPKNVKEAIKKVRPFSVDVASGVESGPGKKDYKKLEEFINAAKQ